MRSSVSPARAVFAAIVSLLVLLPSSLQASAGEGSAAAEHLFNIGPLPITNSIVTSWVVSLALIVAVRLAIGRPRLVPARGQAVVEGVIENVMEVVAPIVGKRVVKAAFPLLVGLFLYILIQNWIGLVPGVGTIMELDAATGHWTSLVRPGNADMNGTFALALVSFVAWLYLIFRYAGPRAVFHDIFGNKADRRDVPAVIYYLLFPIFFAVGLLEIISIVFRPVSLSFRLFGNIFGGENLLHAMSNIFQWGLPVPFYFMELLVGFVQAFVFTLLVSVYIGLICNHGDEHAEGEHAADAAPGH